MTLTHLMAQDLTKFKTFREVFGVLKDLYVYGICGRTCVHENFGMKAPFYICIKTKALCIRGRLPKCILITHIS